WFVIPFVLPFAYVSGYFPINADSDYAATATHEILGGQPVRFYFGIGSQAVCFYFEYGCVLQYSRHRGLLISNMVNHDPGALFSRDILVSCRAKPGECGGAPCRDTGRESTAPDARSTLNAEGDFHASVPLPPPATVPRRSIIPRNIGYNCHSLLRSLYIPRIVA